jgi:hypothetical protein
VFCDIRSNAPQVILFRLQKMGRGNVILDGVL